MDMALYTVRSISYIITDPILIMTLLLFVVLFYEQNKKTSVMQKMIIGEPLNSPFELTISQLVIGILAGVLGSIILSYTGVIFENVMISLLFFISLLLMLINPRFICFSYSASILGFISIATGLISPAWGDSIKIDVVSLMTLVGILHLIEGILVIIDGKTGAIPVFTNKDGKIIGGFALKRYWVLPVAIMIALGTQGTVPGSEQIPTPSWWPLIKGSLSAGFLKNAIISITPIFGAIGYSSITFTKNKTQKAATSGLTIMCFGIALSLVAQFAGINIYTKVFVLLFAPLAHEGMLRFGKYLESKGKPRYVSDNEGIMILDVAPYSPAYEMGVRSGDKLIEINNSKILNESDILSNVENNSNFIWFKIKRATGKIEELSYNKMNNAKRLGLVFVPRKIPEESTVVKIDDIKFKDILDKIKGKKQ